MAEHPEPEPVAHSEPVALHDIAKAVVALAAFAGFELAEHEHVVVQALVGINAVVFLVGLTLRTRNRVTPETRAKARVVAAYEDGLEVGAPKATVVQVGTHTHTDGDGGESALARRAGLLDGVDPAEVETLTRKL